MIPAMSNWREKSAITGSEPSRFSNTSTTAICARGRIGTRRGCFEIPIRGKLDDHASVTHVAQTHVRKTGLALDKPPGRPGPTVAETPAARGTANRRTRARWLGLVRGQRDGRGTRLGAGVAGPGGDAGRVVDGEGAVRGTPAVRRVEVTGRRRLPPRGRPGPCVPVGRGSAPRRLPCPAAPPGQRSR